MAVRSISDGCHKGCELLASQFPAVHCADPGVRTPRPWMVDGYEAAGGTGLQADHDCRCRRARAVDDWHHGMADPAVHPKLLDPAVTGDGVRSDPAAAYAVSGRLACRVIMAALAESSVISSKAVDGSCAVLIATGRQALALALGGVIVRPS